MNKDILVSDMYDRLHDKDKQFYNNLLGKGLELSSFQLLSMYPYINRQLGNTTVSIIKLLEHLLTHEVNKEEFIIEFQRGNKLTYVYIKDGFTGSSFSDEGDINWLNSYVCEIINTYFKEELSIISVSKNSIIVKRI